MGDLISRRAVLDGINELKQSPWFNEPRNIYRTEAVEIVEQLCVKDCPSAQPERDIPVKPIETTDKAWGIPKRQAVCPKCDYYLGHVAFLGDHKGKRITYCEVCGQAIDWEGWEFDAD